MAQKKKVKNLCSSNSQRNLCQQRFFLPEKLNVILIQRTIPRTLRERYQCSVHILVYRWEYMIWYLSQV